jgi:hypothetical protein
MIEDKKQRINTFVKKLIEKTQYNHRNDIDLIQSQVEACEKWDDEFLDAAEKLLLNSESNEDE